MTEVRVSLVAFASVCALLSACAGGSSGTGTAGTSGGGTTGSGAAGTTGSAGTTGAAGTTGTAGTSATGTAGTTGTGGTTGTAGTGGTAGTSGTAGTTGTAGTGGTTGTAGSAGTTGSAGAGGRGGTTGTAGAGGRGGTTGTAGTGGSTAGTGGSSLVAPFFKDDFETGTSGTQPAGWDNFIAYNRNGQNPNGSTLALVDTTRAHGGTKSVHFHGGSSPAQLAKALPTGTNKLYIRAWIWQMRTLGSMNTSENHETLLGLRGSPMNVDNDVRFGEVKGSIGTNETPSDDFAPKLAQPSTATVAANKWACFEIAFLADQAQHTLTAWVDGTQVQAITSTPAQWEHGTLPANWLNGKFVQFIMGWQSFSGIDTDLWIDDVALSTERIGCN